MSKLRNGSKGNSNPGPLDFESGILPLSYRAPQIVMRRTVLFDGWMTLFYVMHRCQPSRIRRDSPAFSSDVPRAREISRCPAGPRNQQMSRIFRKWYFYFFRCRLFYMFASQRNKVTNFEQRSVQNSHADRPLIINTVDPHLTVTSLVRKPPDYSHPGSVPNYIPQCK